MYPSYIAQFVCFGLIIILDLGQAQSPCTYTSSNGELICNKASVAEYKIFMGTLSDKNFKITRLEQN